MSSRAKRGICSPQYQKTRVPHISRFSRCERGKLVPQTPQPALIPRKRRPTQREGLPTKDLCIHPANKIQFLSSRAKRGICKIQFLSSRAKRGICSPQYQKTRVPHISRFSRCGFGKPVAQTPQPAVILRKRRPSQTRRPADEGSLHSHPANKSNSCHPEQSEGSAVLSTRKPGRPTSRVFEMRVSASQPHPQPAVIPRKRRPSQREGLPTKDLCTLQVPITQPFIPSKARDLQPSVSENPGAPHLAIFEMWASEASHTTPSTRRHPEAAQAFATRRPANEGSLHSHPANKSNSCHPEQSEGSAALSTRKPGCPTSRAFRDVGVRSQPHNPLNPPSS